MGVHWSGGGRVSCAGVSIPGCAATVGAVVGVHMWGPGSGSTVVCTPGGGGHIGAGLICCMNPRSMEQSVSMVASCSSVGAVGGHVRVELMVWRAWIILSSVMGFGLGRL